MVPARRTTTAVTGKVVDIPTQLRRAYQTPGWVGSAATTGPDAPPVVQHELRSRPAPAHPAAHTAAQRRPQRPDGLVTHARWTGSQSSSVALVFLIVGFLVAAGAKASGLLQQQTTPGLALALACLLGAAGLYAILVVLRPTVVELDETRLSVRRNGHEDRFDLTNPFQELQVSGKPGTSGWHLALGCPDGRMVRLTGAMVDSRQLDAVVAYAQTYAVRDRIARIDRFSR
ncbi:MAG: hypothetical protein JOZ82_10320 [Marmoricola sp.]|nr:hypothetical protein [Marmoricola sp.]